MAQYDVLIARLEAGMARQRSEHDALAVKEAIAAILDLRTKLEAKITVDSRALPSSVDKMKIAQQEITIYFNSNIDDYMGAYFAHSKSKIYFKTGYLE